MAFQNERVPYSAYDTHDMKKVCGEYNRTHHRGFGPFNFESWNIDHQKDVFLVQIYMIPTLHCDKPEDNFSGYAFCWKGEWMFFDVLLAEVKYDKPRKAVWERLLVRRFVVPDRLVAQREAVIADLKEALITRGVSSIYTDLSGTVEFVGEQWV